MVTGYTFSFFFYTALVASALFYLNIISTIRKIHDSKSTIINNILGCIMTLYIVYSFLILLAD